MNEYRRSAGHRNVTDPTLRPFQQVGRTGLSAPLGKIDIGQRAGP
jgi:hypothetical protein